MSCTPSVHDFNSGLKPYVSLISFPSDSFLHQCIYDTYRGRIVHTPYGALKGTTTETLPSYKPLYIFCYSCLGGRFRPLCVLTMLHASSAAAAYSSLGGSWARGVDTEISISASFMSASISAKSGVERYLSAVSGIMLYARTHVHLNV